jgi:hypothetical protein
MARERDGVVERNRRSSAVPDPYMTITAADRRETHHG